MAQISKLPPGFEVVDSLPPGFEVQEDDKPPSNYIAPLSSKGLSTRPTSDSETEDKSFVGTVKSKLKSSLESVAYPKTAGDMSGLLLMGDVPNAYRTGKEMFTRGVNALGKAYTDTGRGFWNKFSTPIRAIPRFNESLPSVQETAIGKFKGGPELPAVAAPKANISSITKPDIIDEMLAEKAAARAKASTNPITVSKSKAKVPVQTPKPYSQVSPVSTPVIAPQTAITQGERNLQHLAEVTQAKSNAHALGQVNPVQQGSGVPLQPEGSPISKLDRRISNIDVPVERRAIPAELQGLHRIEEPEITTPTLQEILDSKFKRAMPEKEVSQLPPKDKKFKLSF